MYSMYAYEYAYESALYLKYSFVWLVLARRLMLLEPLCVMFSNQILLM